MAKFIDFGSVTFSDARLFGVPFARQSSTVADIFEFSSPLEGLIFFIPLILTVFLFFWVSLLESSNTTLVYVGGATFSS